MYKWSEFSLIHARSHQMKSQSSLLGERQSRMPSRCNDSRKETSTISRLPDSLFSFYPAWSLVQDVQCDVERVTSVAHAPSSIPVETPVAALVNKHAQNMYGKRKTAKLFRQKKVCHISLAACFTCKSLQGAQPGWTQPTDAPFYLELGHSKDTLTEMFWVYLFANSSLQACFYQRFHLATPPHDSGK